MPIMLCLMFYGFYHFLLLFCSCGDSRPWIKDGVPQPPTASSSGNCSVTFIRICDPVKKGLCKFLNGEWPRFSQTVIQGKCQSCHRWSNIRDFIEIRWFMCKICFPEFVCYRALSVSCCFVAFCNVRPPPLWRSLNFQETRGAAVYVPCQGDRVIELDRVSACTYASVYSVSWCIGNGSDKLPPSNAETAPWGTCRCDPCSECETYGPATECALGDTASARRCTQRDYYSPSINQRIFSPSNSRPQRANFLCLQSYPHVSLRSKSQGGNLIYMCTKSCSTRCISVVDLSWLQVQIQFELNRLDDDLEEELLSNQFEGTEYSSEDDINTEPPNIDDATESSSGILDISTSLTTLRDTITTLDALMTTLFTYLDPLFPTDSEPSLEAEQLFDSLLSTFLLHILPTYHSRHAQFLVFKTSQSHSLFLDKFLGLLIERSLNPTISNIGRQASSAYLASFVARAKSLTPDTIKTVVEMLCVFLSRVLEDMPITAQGKFIPGGVAGNRGLDGVYSVFQAVIYIYCFRWRELQTVDEESGEHIWLPQLNVIQRMAWSPLNPLAVFTLVFAVANCSIFHLMLHRSLPNGHTIYSIFSSIQYSKKMPARES